MCGTSPSYFNSRSSPLPLAQPGDVTEAEVRAAFEAAPDHRLKTKTLIELFKHRLHKVCSVFCFSCLVSLCSCIVVFFCSIPFLFWYAFSSLRYLVLSFLCSFFYAYVHAACERVFSHEHLEQDPQTKNRFSALVQKLTKLVKAPDGSDSWIVLKDSK